MCDVSRERQAGAALEQPSFSNAENLVSIRDESFQGLGGGLGHPLKAYIESRAIIEIVIEGFRQDGKLEKYIAIVYCFDGRVFDFNKNTFPLNGFSRNGGLYIGSHYENKQFVLISDIEIVQNAQSVIPSRVWLQALDETDSSSIGPFELFYLSFFEIELGISNGKTRLVDSMPARGNELTGHEVQCGPGVVDGIAGDSCDAGRDRLLAVQAELAHTRIIVDDLTVGFQFEEGAHSPFKFRKVLIRPFYFGARAEPWFSWVDGHVESIEPGIVVWEQ